MPWLPKERMQEWVLDETVQEYKVRVDRWKTEEERRLRTLSRAGTLEEVRRAEARVSILEEVLRDFVDEEEESDE